MDIQQSIGNRITWLAVGAIVPVIAAGIFAFIWGGITGTVMPWLRGDIKVTTTEQIKFQKEPAIIKGSETAKFCALTHVYFEGRGTCRITQKDGYWMIQTGDTDSQQCEVTCWR